MMPGWYPRHTRARQEEEKNANCYPDKVQIFAKELVGLAPDVIACSSNLVTVIVEQETRSITVIFDSSAIPWAAASSKMLCGPR